MRKDDTGEQQLKVGNFSAVCTSLQRIYELDILFSYKYLYVLAFWLYSMNIHRVYSGWRLLVFLILNAAVIWGKNTVCSDTFPVTSAQTVLFFIRYI